MKTTIAVTTVLLAAGLWASEASAFRSANRWGGGTAHTFGATSHTNAWGGSTSHVAGVGTEHTNAYGGYSTHAYGSDTVHSSTYGATAYHGGYYGGSYYGGYHPPVAVPYYASSCYGCAAAAGAVVGLATGAAIASANNAAATSNAYAAGAASSAAAASDAYAAGAANTAAAYNAGAATARVAAVDYEMGVAYASLPSNCGMADMGGTNYYVCSNNIWFKPSFGANGVFYRVVPAPH